MIHLVYLRKPRDPVAFAIAAIIAAILLLVGCLSGCSTANTTTYQGVATTQVAGQTALDAWNQAIPILKPSTNTQYAVRAAFDKWRASMLVVCDAGAAYAAGYGSTNASSLSAALEFAISNATQTKTDFLNLLSQVGVAVSTNSIP